MCGLNLSQETFSSSNSTPPTWSPQQTFQELLAAVVSSQWPRNFSKHLCMVQIPKILLSCHPCYSGTCFVIHTRVCVHSSRTFYAILPFNDKLVMVQWVQRYQVCPSLGPIACALHFYKPCRRHISPQREERCLLSCRELQGRDEGAAQDSLLNGTNFHKLQCIKLSMCGHMNRALNRGRIPNLRTTPLSLLSAPLLCLILLVCCSAASSVIPRCHSLPTSSISRISAQDSFRRNVAQWNCTNFWLGS